MNNRMLSAKLKIFENEFKKFMNIKKFPKYKLVMKEINYETAINEQYLVLANAHYEIKDMSHRLTISVNCNIPKDVLFHEFTHMIDSEMYVNGDAVRYCGLSGFTEYHASQIGLLKLLGCTSLNDEVTFSMNKIIYTISGGRSVYQYVEERRQLAIALFNEDDFPKDIEKLKDALGILFNYWGLRSICEMYAIDYVEEINNEVFLKHISSVDFCGLNQIMHNWLNEERIEESISCYNNMILSIINRYMLR